VLVGGANVQVIARELPPTNIGSAVLSKPAAFDILPLDAHPTTRL